MNKNFESSFNKSLTAIIEGHKNVFENIDRKEIIKHVLDNREAMASKNGALATWTAPESTGRRPKDTYIVKRDLSEERYATLSSPMLTITLPENMLEVVSVHQHAQDLS